MAGKPSKRIIQAMQLVREGETPYAAAKRKGIHLSTMYRSSLYKAWQAEQEAAGTRIKQQQPSERMQSAIAMIKEGIPISKAAKTAEISRASIYQSPLYACVKEKA